MVILKEIKFKNTTDSSSELLVIGHFKNVDIKSSISYLSSDDKDKILKEVSKDLSKSDEGENSIIYGSDKFKKIMFYNLGEKDKIISATIIAPVKVARSIIASGLYCSCVYQSASAKTSLPSASVFKTSIV